MLGWKVPAPDEAMLISGGKDEGNTPFRVVTGPAALDAGWPARRPSPEPRER